MQGNNRLQHPVTCTENLKPYDPYTYGSWKRLCLPNPPRLTSPCVNLVIVNSRFLERPQKQSRGNQLIHRRLIRRKSIGSGQDPENQAGNCTKSEVYGGWSLQLRWGRNEGGMRKRMNQDRIC